MLSSVGLGDSLEGVSCVGVAVSFVGAAAAMTTFSGSVFGVACSLLGAGWASVAVCAGWAASVVLSVLDSTAVGGGLLAAARKHKKLV